MKIKFELIEKDLKSKKKELINNYNEFKKSIETPIIQKNKSKINTEILEKSINIIGYWSNMDKKVIDELLNIEFNIDKSLIKPFAKELNNNLHTKETQEGKKDLIKFYIFEFYSLLNFFKTHSYLINKGQLKNIDPKTYIHIDDNNSEKILNQYENYVVNSQLVFDLLFEEIQICCVKYSIDFFEICHDLNFPLDFNDSGIYMSFEHNSRIKNPNSTVTSNQKIKKPVFTFKIIAGASKKTRAIVLFDALLKEKHVDINSKNDFTNAFIGTPPDNKINWTGLFGDLKSFINYSISENLIEKVSSKWMITSNIFIHNGIHFRNNQIKDTETTTGDNKIKILVKSVL